MTQPKAPRRRTRGERSRTMTAQQWIAAYQRLGVRFEVRCGVVVASGAGVSPLLAACVAKRSKWLVGWVKERQSCICN